MKKTVIAVPEKKGFEKATSHDNEIYINKKLGVPNLKGRNTHYAAPVWLDAKEKGATRVYHILDTYDTSDCTVLILGNSFVLKEVWNNMGNNRKFEYHSLESFDFVEIKEGLLMHHKI